MFRARRTRSPRSAESRRGRWIAAAFFLLAAPGWHPTPASADRRYFVGMYTPYVAPKGSMELETWLTAMTGKQDPSEHTSWEQREEFEYAITDRLTGSFLLTYDQESGGPLRFDAPSIEFVYQLPGTIPGDPALYLETRESGEELEFEPKLLLARRVHRLVSAVNFIGEFEFRHNDEELLTDGSVLRKEWAGEIAAGSTLEVGTNLSVGFEARYRAEYPNFGPRAAAIFSLGPTINLQSEKVQLSLGVHPQLWGDPQTKGNLNLVDFERTRVRVILGIDL
jgi:hypothetical protein